MYPYLFFRTDLSRSHPYKYIYRKRARTGEALRRWLRSVARQWDRRKMIAALEAMDDRILRDIGIYRNDIPRVVDGFDDREIRMRPLATSAATPVDIYDDSHRKAA